MQMISVCETLGLRIFLQYLIHEKWSTQIMKISVNKDKQLVAIITKPSGKIVDFQTFVLQRYITLAFVL